MREVRRHLLKRGLQNLRPYGQLRVQSKNVDREKGWVDFGGDLSVPWVIAVRLFLSLCLSLSLSLSPVCVLLPFGSLHYI